MTLLTSPPPRSPLPSRRSLLRGVTQAAFHAMALLATFFGLAMLMLFAVQLSRDALAWFRVMPVLIRAEGEALQARADQARDREGFFASQFKALDEEMERELQRAADEAERQEIRSDYARIKQTRQADLELKRQEYLLGEKFIRPDTSPLALLGFFFTHGPSNAPQDAGIRPALLGSIALALITVVCAVPLGVGAAIYLEEYRQSGWLARIIQVNINNLAGVPSVMYSILGAFIFVDLIFRPMERQGLAPRNLLGGGLTLALLTLPVMIVSSQEAIRAVPVSLRQAALALGATRWQTIWRVVLPASLPGILTGTILALSRTLGEAAPLVMFGALLYVDQDPSLFSRFTVLPMQIFNWSSRPELEWRYNAAVAILVLVATLLALNATAIYLRQRLRRRIRW